MVSGQRSLNSAQNTIQLLLNSLNNHNMTQLLANLITNRQNTTESTTISPKTTTPLTTTTSQENQTLESNSTTNSLTTLAMNTTEMNTTETTTSENTTNTTTTDAIDITQEASAAPIVFPSTTQTITTTAQIMTTTTKISSQKPTNTSSAAPIVLRTTKTPFPQRSSTTTSPSSGVTSNTSNIIVTTARNLYPQDVGYSCPSPVNGCRGPTDCLYKFPGDCTKFFHCSAGGQAFIMDCPIGTQWNDIKRICDWPINAHCN